MTKLLILGDVHGDWAALNITVKKAIAKHPDIEYTIQLGDFGDGWPGKSQYIYDEDIWQGISLYWLDGNHDNHELLNQGYISTDPRINYVSRGSVVSFNGFSALFMGGATSIDRGQRIVGADWWPEESITEEQLQRALNLWGAPEELNLPDPHIDIIFSHDCPLEVFESEPFTELFPEKFRDGLSDRVALQTILEKYRPPYWFFGHYHETMRWDNGTTKFELVPWIHKFQYSILELKNDNGV